MERIEEENYDDAQDFSISSERMRTGLTGGHTLLSSTVPTLEPLLKNGILKEPNESQNNSTNWFRRSKKWLCRNGSSKRAKSNNLASRSVPSIHNASENTNGTSANGGPVPAETSSHSSTGPTGPESAPVTYGGNGIAPSEKPSTGSHCSVKVYCVTNEASV